MIYTERESDEGKRLSIVFDNACRARLASEAEPSASSAW